jgi:hypothetical protein
MDSGALERERGITILSKARGLGAWGLWRGQRGGRAGVVVVVGGA